MSGNLMHGKDFRSDVYKGADGQEHSELIPVDGDFFSLTNKTWLDIVQTCEGFGVPTEGWPVYEDSIDVPLDDVRKKNSVLHYKITSLPEQVVTSSEWLHRIVSFVKQGEMIVYCRM